MYAAFLFPSYIWISIGLAVPFLFALYLILRQETGLFRQKKSGKQYRLNWEKEPEDTRDYKYGDALQKKTLRQPTPTAVDLTELIPEIYDQGDIGSCTGNAGAMAGLHRSRVQNREIAPSRLMLYYGARELIGQESQDYGAYMRDVYKAWNKKGVCPEMTWPYVESRVTHKPSEAAYREGQKTLATAYFRLDNTSLEELKTCLADGHPFTFGFWVYDSFFWNWKDTMPIPNPNKERFLGGHAVTAVGYDNQRAAFRIKNSWGINWKDGGYFWMPYAFITNTKFCDDFWMLDGITPGEAPAPTPTKITTVVDLAAIFHDRKGLCRLREYEIVLMGQKMGLNTNAAKRKSENVDIVMGGLGL